MNTPHPEPETLAELADVPDQADVSGEIPAHVANCEQCTRDLVALRQVRETLRALPPVPMPDDVSARIEFALGAEIGALRAEKPAAAAISVLPSRADRQHRLSGRRFAHFPAAAAIAVLAVVIVGTGIAAIATSSGGGSSKSSSATAGAAIAGDKAVVLASGTDYDKAAIRNQVAALVLNRVPDSTQRYKGLTPLAGSHHATAAGGGSPAPQFNSPAASAAAAPSAPAAAASNGAATSNGGAFGTGVTAPTAPGGPLASNAALQACIVALVGQSVTPVLVDYALYDGQPATIIVLPDPTIPNTLDLYVEYYTADCVKDGDVSFFATLPTS